MAHIELNLFPNLAHLAIFANLVNLAARCKFATPIIMVERKHNEAIARELSAETTVVELVSGEAVREDQRLQPLLGCCCFRLFRLRCVFCVYNVFLFEELSSERAVFEDGDR